MVNVIADSILKQSEVFEMFERIEKDKVLLEDFERIAQKNKTTAEVVIADFIKDYIVSNGHPEEVVNKYPWNKKQ